MLASLPLLAVLDFDLLRLPLLPLLAALYPLADDAALSLASN